MLTKSKGFMPSFNSKRLVAWKSSHYSSVRRLLLAVAGKWRYCRPMRIDSARADRSIGANRICRPDCLVTIFGARWRRDHACHWSIFFAAILARLGALTGPTLVSAVVRRSSHRRPPPAAAAAASSSTAEGNRERANNRRPRPTASDQQTRSDAATPNRSADTVSQRRRDNRENKKTTGRSRRNRFPSERGAQLF